MQKDEIFGLKCACNDLSELEMSELNGPEYYETCKLNKAEPTKIIHEIKLLWMSKLPS